MTRAPRTIGTIGEACRSFASFGPISHSRLGEVYWEDDLIWASGGFRRWIMARRFKDFFLVNADEQRGLRGRSRSLRDALKKEIAIFVSFSALREHGVNIEQDHVEVLDSRPDKTVFIDARAPDVITQVSALTDYYGRIGSWIQYAHTGEIYFHATGDCLLKIGPCVFWGAIDHGDYFVAELSVRQVKTIKDAIESLAPRLMGESVLECEGTQRQGEYFFVPANRPILNTLTPLRWVRMTDGHVQGWPVNMGWSNRWARRRSRDDSESLAHHTASHAVFYDGNWYAKGQVRDSEHGKLILGDQWHQVMKNTQIRSFSASQMGVRID